ncbi:MAG: class I tRNA ligase family protein, partial [Candidatus Omnitrophota bacterium]
VARMMMAGLEFRKDIPFREVYIHGTVRVEGGKKMSKSLGNIIDPLEVIEELGADALRFSLMVITATGSDVYLSKQKFLIGRNFGNKIWNATRFIFPHLEGERLPIDAAVLDDTDRWILSRLQGTIQEVTEAFSQYRFNEAAGKLYEFFWHQFCDWYLEMTKTRQSREIAPVLAEVLEKFLLLLHPIMPFLTEEIWQKLSPGSSIMIHPWPNSDPRWLNEEAEKRMSFVMRATSAIRTLRSELQIPPKTILSVLQPKTDIVLSDPPYGPFLADNAKVKIAVEANAKKPKHSATVMVDNHPIHILLEGVVNFESERERIAGEIEKRKAQFKKTQSLLSDDDFLSRAPEEIVEKTRQSLLESEEGIREMEQLLEELR